MKLEPTEAQRKAMLAWAQENNPWDPESFVDGLIAAANSIPEGPPVGTKIEPTGVQRFLMAEAAADSDASGWSDDPEDWLPIVDAQIAAANRVDDIPVGTIARRPDGGWLAHYYTNLSGTRAWLYWPLSADDDEDFPDDDAADSWPVIYDPDEYHEGDKPRLERLMREPSVFDADPTAQQEPALRERFPEQASAYVADPELAEVDDEPLPSGSLITPKPRTPRVVDRLGVDEQGSPWRELLNGWAWVYLYDPKTDRWQRQTPNGRVKRYKPGAEPHRRGPFIEWGDPS
ncbi:hypothetical protein [Mycobacteroides abscessus]|uniref:hypothetical protein n=1 Tax=Mycobacteroides abscessus TaxID=36809 RepID=UPI000A34D1A0|nr:hypothetical protein [Mycobacteroides abscessus]OTR08866.1 hypothetical protein B9M83_09080 [Mycobacteroides abscessus]OTR13914.1 hypothetical protein B9M82_09655 [Mycobacteroides abscessus]